MLVKVKMNKAIRDFLESDLIYNLNVLGVIDNTPDAEIYVDDERAPKGVMVRKDYFNYIYSEDDKFIDEMLESHFVEGFFGFSGLKKSIADKIRNRFMNSWESKCTLYYLPEGALDLSLIKTPVRDIDIKDAEVVDKHYTYRSPWSIHEIRENITNRPSSAVYVDGDIACWVLIHKDDSMGIMYTKEEHRQKGYAVDVTIDLAEKIIKRGKIPYLQIVEGNSMSPGLANKCGFIPHGKCEWFGIIVGVPNDFVELSKKGEEILINELSPELKKVMNLEDFTEKHLYNATFELKKIEHELEGFKVEKAKSKNDIKKWCEIVASSYCSSKEKYRQFNDELLNTVTKENSLFNLWIGYLNGGGVSAIATLVYEEEICGLYFNSTVAEAKNQEIEKATILEALKLEDKNYIEFVVLQTSKEKVCLYEDLGFMVIPEEKVV